MSFLTNGACRIYTPTSSQPLSPKFGQGGKRGGDDRYRSRWIITLFRFGASLFQPQAFLCGFFNLKILLLRENAPMRGRACARMPQYIFLKDF